MAIRASVEDKGWTNAEDLQMGDKVRQANGTTGIVWLQWNTHKTQEMYNITVATAHTFFVGDGQWLVPIDCEDESTVAQQLQILEGARVGITQL